MAINDFDGNKDIDHVDIYRRKEYLWENEIFYKELQALLSQNNISQDTKKYIEKLLLEQSKLSNTKEVEKCSISSECNNETGWLAIRIWVENRTKTNLNNWVRVDDAFWDWWKRNSRNISVATSHDVSEMWNDIASGNYNFNTKEWLLHFQKDVSNIVMNGLNSIDNPYWLNYKGTLDYMLKTYYSEEWVISFLNSFWYSKEKLVYLITLANAWDPRATNELKVLWDKVLKSLNKTIWGKVADVQSDVSNMRKAFSKWQISKEVFQYTDEAVRIAESMGITDLSLGVQLQYGAIIWKAPNWKYVSIDSRWRLIEWNSKADLLKSLSWWINSPYLFVGNAKTKQVTEYVNHEMRKNMWWKDLWDSLFIFDRWNSINLTNNWWNIQLGDKWYVSWWKDKYWISGEVWYSWENISADVHAKTNWENYATVWWEVKWRVPVSQKTAIVAWLSWEATVAWEPWKVQSVWWYAQAWVWVESQLNNWWKVEAWLVTWFVPRTTLTTGWVEDQVRWAWLEKESTMLQGKYTAPSWNSVYWKVGKTGLNLWEWKSEVIWKFWWTKELWNMKLDASVSWWEGKKWVEVWVTFNLDWKSNNHKKSFKDKLYDEIAEQKDSSDILDSIN